MATMTDKQIADSLKKGYVPQAYVCKSGYVAEVDFSTRDNSLMGWSFECVINRQRELKSLINRIKKQYPKMKILKA